MRAGNRADVPGIGHRAAVFKQADAEPVASVRRLLDEPRLAHGGKQPVNGAFRPAGRLIQLGKRRGLRPLCQQIQQADCLCHGVNRFGFKLCHTLCLLRVFQCLFLVYHAFHCPASGNRSALSKFVFRFCRRQKEAHRAPFVSVYQIVSSNGEASTSLSAGTASAAPGLVTAIALATVACRSVSRMERFCTMPRTK